MKLMDKLRNEPPRAREPQVHPQVQEPARPVDEPAGKLHDTDVEDAVEIARREARTDTRAADTPADDPLEQHATEPRAPERRERRPMPEEQRLTPLFAADVAQGFRTRWDTTQIGFVDDPRRAVQQADELVGQVMRTLTQGFADERRQLEAQMHDERASTENLRVALQRYRSFFDRLLSL